MSNSYNCSFGSSGCNCDFYHSTLNPLTSSEPPWEIPCALDSNLEVPLGTNVYSESYENSFCLNPSILFVPPDSFEGTPVGSLEIEDVTPLQCDETVDPVLKEIERLKEEFVFMLQINLNLTN